MDLKTIQAGGAWGTGATDINDNFSTTNVEIEKLKNSVVNFKGYYTDLTSLSALVPVPKAGDYAWVGTPYPGVVYKCQTAGTWTATTEVPSEQEVDLANYVTTTQLQTALDNWDQTDW
jgi:hypothetical protein